jgi:hypothetical protein
MIHASWPLVNYLSGSFEANLIMVLTKKAVLHYLIFNLDDGAIFLNANLEWLSLR